MPITIVRPAILLPALFGGSGAERAFLAVADRFHPVGRNSQRNQELFCRRGAPVPQSQIVLRGTAFVAMAFDDDLQLRIGAQELSGLREGVASVSADIRLVIVEVSVLHFLVE